MQDDTSECGESFRDSRKRYGMSRFGEKFKRSWIRKLEEEKRLGTNEFGEDSRNSQKTKTKVTVRRTKLKNNI